jgi:hypothetical protein
LLAKALARHKGLTLPGTVSTPWPEENSEDAQESERRAAYEKHWTRLWLFDREDEARYAAGRISVQDFLESREHRLQAEIWMIRGQRSKSLFPNWTSVQYLGAFGDTKVGQNKAFCAVTPVSICPEAPL